MIARWVLRIAVTASVLLVAAHFAFTLSTFHSLTLESVQFAELGLPLLFAALLNGVVWSLDRPSRLARLAAHCANVLLLLVALLVARLSPVAPAYLIVACATLLWLAALLGERRGARATRVAVAHA